MLKPRALAYVTAALGGLQAAESQLNEACCEQAPGVMARISDLESPTYQSLDQIQKEVGALVQKLKGLL